MSHELLKEDYKLLGLDKNATLHEARRAYHKLKTLYAEGSLATYSLMTTEQREEKLDRIERAYMRIAREIDSRSSTRATPFLYEEAGPPGPPEPGEGLGAYLKRCRENLGLTLKDVAGRTRVRTTYLENIEKENLANLPAPVYLRGFVLEFAKVLDVPDPESITNAYLKLLSREEE